MSHTESHGRGYRGVAGTAGLAGVLAKRDDIADGERVAVVVSGVRR